MVRRLRSLYERLLAARAGPPRPTGRHPGRRRESKVCCFPLLALKPETASAVSSRNRGSARNSVDLVGQEGEQDRAVLGGPRRATRRSPGRRWRLAPGRRSPRAPGTSSSPAGPRSGGRARASRSPTSRDKRYGSAAGRNQATKIAITTAQVATRAEAAGSSAPGQPDPAAGRPDRQASRHRQARGPERAGEANAPTSERHRADADGPDEPDRQPAQRPRASGSPGLGRLDHQPGRPAWRRPGSAGR